MKPTSSRINQQFNPAGDEERALVQAIADTEWRLLRIPSLESAILAVGRVKLADLYPNEADPATRAAFIEAEVQIAYRKDLSNLALQETRLRRNRHLDTEKLESLQARRREAEQRSKNMTLAVKLYENAAESGHTFVPELFGFEFSLAEIQRHIHLEDFKGNMTGQYKTMSPAEYEKAFARFVPGQEKTAIA